MPALVVDHSAFFCEALASVLTENHCDVIGWSTEERDALRLARRAAPSLVLTEIELATGSGLSLARQLGRDMPVVLLTRHDESEVLFDAVVAGAAGCLTHAIDVHRLLSSMEEAASGRFAVDTSRLAPALRIALRRERGDDGSMAQRLAGLTAREREVLALVAEARSNAEIAQRLGLSPHTVRTHVGNLLKKLEIHTRAEAAHMYLSAQASRSATLEIQGPDL